MLGSPNLHRGNAPLTTRLKIDDLNAHLAALDSFGVGGLSSAMTDGVRMAVRGFTRASRGALRCPLRSRRDCEAA